MPCDMKKVDASVPLASPTTALRPPTSYHRQPCRSPPSIMSLSLGSLSCFCLFLSSVRHVVSGSGTITVTTTAIPLCLSLFGPPCCVGFSHYRPSLSLSLSLPPSGLSARRSVPTTHRPPRSRRWCFMWSVTPITHK